MKGLKAIIVLVLALLIAFAVVGPALASDHLFDAVNSEGVGERGFTNPVTNNPSGVSGPNARPGTVPGEGNPNSGQDLGTPSVNCDLLNPNANPAFCDN